MIPITLGVMSSQKERSRGSVVFFAGLYVLGMSTVYSALGVFSAFSGRLFGSLSGNSGFLAGLGIFLTGVALFMLEVLHLDISRVFSFFTALLPEKGLAQKKKSSAVSFNAVQAFFLGVSSGFIAAPCTTPVLTAILVFISETRSVALGFLLMFAFALGLGTLLFVLACFAGFLKALPRSGMWMQRVKIFGGLVILAYAEYLIFRSGKGAS
jgi:thiol:disulfide interchange protein DsbD